MLPLLTDGRQAADMLLGYAAIKGVYQDSMDTTMDPAKSMATIREIPAMLSGSEASSLPLDSVT